MWFYNLFVFQKKVLFLLHYENYELKKYSVILALILQSEPINPVNKIIIL